MGRKWERHRFVGDARVSLSWNDAADAYEGEIRVAGKTLWEFSGLRLGGAYGHLAVDGPEAFDRAAVAACAFGTSPSVEDGPTREVAGTIEDATLAALDGGGNENRYYVRRQEKGPSYGPYV